MDTVTFNLTTAKVIIILQFSILNFKLLRCRVSIECPWSTDTSESVLYIYIIEIDFIQSFYGWMNDKKKKNIMSFKIYLIWQQAQSLMIIKECNQVVQ